MFLNVQSQAFGLGVVKVKSIDMSMENSGDGQSWLIESNTSMCSSMEEYHDDESVVGVQCQSFQTSTYSNTDDCYMQG
ncbi:hypothetical protein E2542_SST20865 [Spatholobus suberectus]|nr:hypothetical protein E2542_SST20865 [Spatholobus suberectus]